MNADGSGQTQLTFDPQPKDQVPDWSPDGSKIAYLADTHGMEWVIAVPHNIVGPRQKYDDPYRNVASIFINMMLQGRQPYIYGDGSQMRCFSFVSDDIEPLKKMAFDPRCAGEVINIGPDDEFVSINELAEIIARLLQFGTPAASEIGPSGLCGAMVA
jgi:UDP-glucose 4-epimerase